MAEDAAHDLQVWLVAVLDADAGVGALVGDRIYDVVPSDGVDGMGVPVPSAAFPYIRIGPVSAEDRYAGECDQQDVSATVTAFSRAGGKREAHLIAGACKAAIRAANFAGAPARTWGGGVRVTDSRVGTDPDGLTMAAVMQIRGLLTRVS